MMKCPYCNNDAELVTGAVIYPHIEKLRLKCFWRCAPCDAYVGCHRAGSKTGDGTRPLGTLANKRLRDLRMMVHNRLDTLWSNSKERIEAYSWLAEKLNIPEDKCHVAMFDCEMCKRAIDALDEMDHF